MNDKNPANFRPHTFASLRKKPIHFLAFGLGSGLIHPAPGTWGTLAATLLFILGCWVCDKTARDLGVHDFGEIVWDEFLGVWLVLAYLPPALWTRWGTLLCYLAAFLLFRLFDITKPPPIRQIDRHTPGGLGIMLDDVLAAGYALAALWLAAAVL